MLKPPLGPPKTAWGVLRLIADTFRWSLHDRIARVLVSAFVLIMLWGTHGRVDLLRPFIVGWTGPGGDPERRAKLIRGLPWDQEWIAFAIGAVLLVLVPCLLIRFWFRESPLDYGLGLPRRGTWRFTLISTLLLSALAFPSMYIAARNPEMRATYPFFRDLENIQQFIKYEAGYLVFFVTVEFTFRGYLLFGLYRVQDSMAARPARHETPVESGLHLSRNVTGSQRTHGAEPLSVSVSDALGVQGPLVFGYYSILISMLSYTAWHLGKPLPEQYGTLLWGVATGVMALRSGSIWHIVLVHFLMNVMLDYLIWSSG